MKIIRLIIAGIFFSSLCVAQPVITFSKHMPDVGDWYRLSTIEEFNGITAGSEGSNQVWDFSQYVSSSEITATIVEPENTPYPELATEVDFAIGTGNDSYQFIKVDNGAYYWNKAVINNNLIDYNDPVKVLELPFTYGDITTDKYNYIIEEEGMTQQLYGDLTIVADAWGNITTPAGTFENTLRVKRIYIDTTTTQYGSFSYDFYDTITEYLWFTEELFYPVYTITELASMSESVTARYLIDYLKTSVVDQTIKNDFISVFPNPASQYVNINSAEPLKKVSLSDMTGKAIDLTNSRLIENYNVKINLDGLADGIYFLQAESCSGKLYNQKLIIKN